MFQISHGLWCQAFGSILLLWALGGCSRVEGQGTGEVFSVQEVTAAADGDAAAVPMTEESPGRTAKTHVSVGVPRDVSPDEKKAKSAVLSMPEPGVDDPAFLVGLQRDINAHPNIAALKLDIRVVRVKGGYVTLALLNGPPHVAHQLAHEGRMLAQELAVRERVEELARLPGQDGSDLLQTFIEVYRADPPGPENRQVVQAIRALESVQEIVRRHPKCKAVFWRELPITHARHLFREANDIFGCVWQPYLAVPLKELRGEQDEAVIQAAVTKALCHPEVITHWLAVVGGESGFLRPGDVVRREHPGRTRWLASFEEALEAFPAAREKWRDVRTAVRAQKFTEAIDLLESLVEEFPSGEAHAPLHTAAPRGLCASFAQLLRARASGRTEERQ